jgi:hypothetical protein
MNIWSSKFSTIYGEPQQGKLPFSDRFSHAGISWISSRSPIYEYGYRNRGILLLSNTKSLPSNNIVYFTEFSLPLKSQLSYIVQTFVIAFGKMNSTDVRHDHCLWKNEQIKMRELWLLGFHGYFCCVEQRGCFEVVFQNMEILPNDISKFEIEWMIS